MVETIIIPIVIAVLGLIAAIIESRGKRRLGRTLRAVIASAEQQTYGWDGEHEFSGDVTFAELESRVAERAAVTVLNEDNPDADPVYSGPARPARRGAS